MKRRGLEGMVMLGYLFGEDVVMNVGVGTFGDVGD